MSNRDNENLDQIQEELIEEEQKRAKKQEMPVSGRSVFEIKRLKDEKHKKK